jgi:hypothetical protein
MSFSAEAVTLFAPFPLSSTLRKSPICPGRDRESPQWV